MNKAMSLPDGESGLNRPAGIDSPLLRLSPDGESGLITPSTYFPLAVIRLSPDECGLSLCFKLNKLSLSPDGEWIKYAPVLVSISNALWSLPDGERG